MTLYVKREQLDFKMLITEIFLFLNNPIPYGVTITVLFIFPQSVMLRKLVQRLKSGRETKNCGMHGNGIASR